MDELPLSCDILSTQLCPADRDRYGDRSLASLVWDRSVPPPTWECSVRTCNGMFVRTWAERLNTPGWCTAMHEDIGPMPPAPFNNALVPSDARGIVRRIALVENSDEATMQAVAARMGLPVSTVKTWVDLVVAYSEDRAGLGPMNRGPRP